MTNITTQINKAESVRLVHYVDGVKTELHKTPSGISREYTLTSKQRAEAVNMETGSVRHFNGIGWYPGSLPSTFKYN